MKAALFKAERQIEVGERPDPGIQDPTDVVVRVVRGCVCGSDLWYYRGVNDHKAGSIGHEYIGVVEEVGSEVRGLTAGDLVIAPFTYNDGTCPACRHGFQSQCEHGGSFGNGDTDGGQGERVRAPYADATLVKVPGSEFTDAQLASFTALSDVMCTGYHAAVSAGVKEGDTVAVVGDGAVGLSAVLAAHLLGPLPRSSVPPTSSRSAASRPSRPCCVSRTGSAWTRRWSAWALTRPSRPRSAWPGPVAWSARSGSRPTPSSITRPRSGRT